MSGVGISGLLANLPNTVTPYPVLDQGSAGSLVLGGYRTVDTVAALTGILAQFKVEGMLAYCKATQCFYALGSDLATWTIVANNGLLGRQATWVIDPQNTTGLASNANDGKTAATPLLTYQEFQDRCFPLGAALYIRQNTTVTVLGTSAFSIPHVLLNVQTDISTATILNFTFVLPVTNTANLTLTNVVVTNATPGSRAGGELTVSSGAFTTGERIRVTSGAALGSEAYSFGAHAGATNHYCSNFGKDAVNNFLWPAIGDTVVVDTLLTTINRLEVWAGQLCRVVVQDAKVTSLTVNGSGSDAALTAGGGNLTLVGCQEISASGRFQASGCGATLVNCRTIATSKTTHVGPEWMVVNHFVEGTFGLGAGSMISYGVALSGGHMVVGSSSDFNHTGDDGWSKWFAFGISAASNVGAVEAENGAAGTAILVAPGASIVCDSFKADFWGLRGTYPVGFDLFGTFDANDSVVEGLSSIMAIPATIQQRVGGDIPLAYSDTPSYSRVKNAGARQLNVAGVRWSEAAIYRTAQAANIAATTLAPTGTGGAYKGSYRVSGYLAITTASGGGGAGNLQLQVTYTDDTGVAQTATVCSIAALTALAGAGGEIIIETNGPASAMTFQVAGIVSAGLLQYTVRLNVRLDSIGP